MNPNAHDGRPMSVFKHIEPGDAHPKIGLFFGMLGLVIGLLSPAYLLFASLYSVAVTQILDPGFAIIGGVFWGGILMLAAAMMYKFAHELGGERASRFALYGFTAPLLSIPIAFLYLIACRFLDLRFWGT